jgi:hypothetical protein
MGGGDAPASEVDMTVLTLYRNIHLCNAPMHETHTGKDPCKIGMLARDIRRMGKSMLPASANLERKTFRKNADRRI